MVTIHKAKTTLSKLVKDVEESGKEITIARGKKPAAKLVPISKPLKRRRLGVLKGKLHAPPEAFAPLTDEELKDWGY